MVNSGSSHAPTDASPQSDTIPTAARKRICVMISGRGSNMAALIAATMQPDYPAVITHVISNRANAAGLESAEANELETAVFDNKDFASSEDQEQAIMEQLDTIKPDIICLAGYMRILSSTFVNRYKGKILNIHPSLLPAFKGLDTHHRAIANGVRVHGCSVHFVTDVMDEGPIIAQAAVPVLPNDNDDSLAERVLRAEHRLYPAAVRLVATGRARMTGGHVAFSGDFAVGERSVFSPMEGEDISLT